MAGTAAHLLHSWSEVSQSDLGWRQAVPEIWLEYDFPEPVGPGCPLSNRSSPHGPPWRGPVTCLRLGEPLELVSLQRLLPDSTDAALYPRLGHLMAAVEPPLSLLYVFDLSARGSSGIRLEIYGEALPPLVRFLERHMPTGFASRIAALDLLLGDADRFHLSFDVLPDGISPRLGLEASYRRLPHREPRWARLLDRLQAAGLCSEAERRGLDRWPGTDRAATSQAWPQGAGGFCVRCLSHVKLVSMPQEPLRAKAYLLFQHLDRQATGGVASGRQGAVSTS